jgi:RNA polymerase sigma factor (sigma-70 family)
VSLDPDKVYETARSLLPAAISFLKKKGLDPTLVEDFLMEAAQKLLDRKSSPDIDIENLPGYLFTSFKHLALDELRKNQRYQDVTEEQIGSLSDRETAARKIERDILREEIVRHLNAEARFIFNYLALGYSFREISSLFSERFGSQIAENALRSRYSKALQQAAKKLRS